MLRVVVVVGGGAAAAAVFFSVFLTLSEGVNSSGMDGASTKRDGDMMVSSARAKANFLEVFNEGLNFFEKWHLKIPLRSAY